VTVHHGTILNALQPRPSARDHGKADFIQKWRMRDAMDAKPTNHVRLL
jgi:hypothetical protein